MSGYEIKPGQKLTGNVNASHVVLNLPPCSLPMPNGDGSGSPLHSCRHHDGPASIVDLNSLRNKNRAQSQRQRREKERANVKT